MYAARSANDAVASRQKPDLLELGDVSWEWKSRAEKSWALLSTAWGTLPRSFQAWIVDIASLCSAGVEGL